MYCRKCGKKIPDQATFCDSCGTEVSSVQEQKVSAAGSFPESYPRQMNTGSAAAVGHKNRAIWIVPVALLIGLVIFFVFKNTQKADPLLGTWYLQVSELTGQPISVTFAENTVTFGAGAIQNQNAMTLKYEKVGEDSLKIYSEKGDDSAVCSYRVEGDRLCLSSATERSLNLVFVRHTGNEVPVN